MAPERAAQVARIQVMDATRHLTEAITVGGLPSGPPVGTLRGRTSIRARELDSGAERSADDRSAGHGEGEVGMAEQAA